MRGKLVLFAGQALCSWITPADAGKTRCWAASRVLLRDHPRGCGENLPDFKFSGDVKGSPPRMRGKLPSSIASSILYRITPADAGKTALMPDGGAVKWDHPRGCGENHEGKVVSAVHQGSPPRMRGKPVTKQLWHRRVGITPADAGKTRHAMLAANRRWDHPRGCGENGAIKDSGNRTKGSPPRMRGKRSVWPMNVPAEGITPADAGKTLRGIVNNACAKDHPRGCGENRCQRQPIIEYIWITPADAGKTYTPRE